MDNHGWQLRQFTISHMTKIEVAMLWLYVKSWHPHNARILDAKKLWVFSSADFEQAILRVTHKMKTTEKTEYVDLLKAIILGRFNNEMDFFNWSKDIHEIVGYYPFTP